VTPDNFRISVIYPINPALERVRTILFRPFDLGRWFIIGFCAWLAYLGKGGGPNLNFGRAGPSDVKLDEALHYAKEYTVNNLYWIAPLIVIGVIISIVLWLLFTWLSSRGRFMFLHCVAENKAEVKVPCDKFREHANSLFIFRIILGIIGFLVGIFLMLIGILFFLSFKSMFGFNPFTLAGLVLISLTFIAVVIVLAIIQKFTEDFVVPIMFLRTTSCFTAWREFLTLLSAHKAHFLLYILFSIFIAISIGVTIMATVCITCCCAGCILAIPYISTVLLLPIHIFKRSYSLYYLCQFGSRFDVFAREIVTSNQ
jgi:hypothetical protein